MPPQTTADVTIDAPARDDLNDLDQIDDAARSATPPPKVDEARATRCNDSRVASGSRTNRLKAGPSSAEALQDDTDQPGGDEAPASPPPTRQGGQRQQLDWPAGPRKSRAAVEVDDNPPRRSTRRTNSTAATASGEAGAEDGEDEDGSGDEAEEEEEEEATVGMSDKAKGKQRERRTRGGAEAGGGRGGTTGEQGAGEEQVQSQVGGRRTRSRGGMVSPNMG